MIVNGYYFYQSEDLMMEDCEECQIDLADGRIIGITRETAPDWMEYEFIWMNCLITGTMCDDFDIIWEGDTCYVVELPRLRESLGVK